MTALTVIFYTFVPHFDGYFHEGKRDCNVSNFKIIIKT